MKELIKKKWRNKRFKKFKKIDVEGQTEQEFKPIPIADGDESKTGDMPLEIDFNDLEDETDIYFEGVDHFEFEYFLKDDGEAMIWLKVDNLEQGDQIEMYYGRRSRIAKLFDKYVNKIRKPVHDPRDVKMVQHLESDSQ